MVEKRWLRLIGQILPVHKWCLAVLPVHAIGRASVKRVIRPDLILEGHGACQPLLGGADALVGLEIDLFLFETPP